MEMTSLDETTTEEDDETPVSAAEGRCWRMAVRIDEEEGPELRRVSTCQCWKNCFAFTTLTQTVRGQVPGLYRGESRRESIGEASQTAQVS